MMPKFDVFHIFLNGLKLNHLNYHRGSWDKIASLIKPVVLTAQKTHLPGFRWRLADSWGGTALETAKKQILASIQNSLGLC